MSLETKHSRPLWKYVLASILLLAVPTIPFLVLGEPMEERMTDWLRSRDSARAVAAGVLALLTIDVLLPVPSSIVCTLSGAFLGLVPGTLMATLGMTSGALLGFALGRLFGRLILCRFADAEERRDLDRLVDRFGISILILLRPVPLVAEASTLFLGCTSLRWTTFLAATLPIHFLLALLYALLGRHFGVPTGTVLSVAIALSLSLVAKMFLKRNRSR